MGPFIKIEHLTKRFGEQVVIDNFSLDIEERDVVVIQGPSGIGKSTLLRCLTCLESFQEGFVKVGNIEARAGTTEVKDPETVLRLREQLGFVFQFFNLFPHLTVLENLMIGPTRVLKEPVEEARTQALLLLNRVNLRDKADSYPAALSGGQQQRVGIARALAMHPKGVLFDEPTSSLDPAMKAEIIHVMADFAKEGLTMVVVTHEPEVVQRIATRLVTLGEKCRIR